jgi:hypothetical protein
MFVLLVNRTDTTIRQDNNFISTKLKNCSFDSSHKRRGETEAVVAKYNTIIMSISHEEHTWASFGVCISLPYSLFGCFFITLNSVFFSSFLIGWMV